MTEMTETEKQLCKEVRQLRHAIQGDGVYVGLSGRVEYLEREGAKSESWDKEIFRMKIMAVVAILVSVFSLATTIIQVWGSTWGG